MPFERTNSEQEVTISGERFQQLIRAEQDANLLKAFVAKKYEDYGNVCRAELELLYTMFIGKKEEADE